MILADLTTRLETISLNPCACNVCKHAARLAKEALMQVSPLSEKLLQTPERDSDEFRAIERQFRDEEFTRLSNALAYIKRGKCIMTPSTKEPILQTQTPPLPTTQTPPLSTVPTLPYDETSSSKLENYRKFRARHIEMKKNPRVPGSYWIKPRSRED